MRGCERCGRVPGELALQNSGVRDGSMTMGFLAKFFVCAAQEEICCFNVGLHTAERLDGAELA